MENGNDDIIGSTGEGIEPVYEQVGAEYYTAENKLLDRVFRALLGRDVNKKDMKVMKVHKRFYFSVGHGEYSLGITIGGKDIVLGWVSREVRVEEGFYSVHFKMNKAAKGYFEDIEKLYSAVGDIGTERYLLNKELKGAKSGMWIRYDDGTTRIRAVFIDFVNNTKIRVKMTHGEEEVPAQYWKIDKDQTPG